MGFNPPRSRWTPQYKPGWTPKRLDHVKDIVEERPAPDDGRLFNEQDVECIDKAVKDKE